MAWERLRQIKADFPVPSVQPGGKLRNQAVGPSTGLLTMPSHLRFLDESVPSILADGLLCARVFLQVGAGKLLAKLKVLLSFLRQLIYWRDACQDKHSARRDSSICRNYSQRDKSLRREQFPLDSMVLQGISPDQSCIKLATSLLFASLGPPMFGISQAEFASHWMALAAAIFRCSPKLSLPSSCTPRYLMLIFQSTSCSPRTILGY